MPALQVRDLKKTYTTPDGAPCPVIDVATLDVGDGEQVALRGGSGTGKTTLLNLIAGILRPDAGSIRVGGTEIVGLSESARDRLRSLEIGYVFQTFNLLQGFTSTENVVLAQSFGRGADAGRARELLERVGLKDRLNHRPRQLSVGQQQRVAIARALANRPKLVLADEPTGNLDPKNAAECLALIREVCRESQAALLLVSHDQTVLEAFEKRLDLAEINRASQGVAR